MARTAIQSNWLSFFYPDICHIIPLANEYLSNLCTMDQLFDT